VIKIVNHSAFKAQVNAWVNSVRAGAEKVVYRMMYDAQLYAMSRSPVYSGDFASNWNVSYGTPDTTFREGPTISRDYGRGLSSPRDSIWGRGNFSMTGFQLGQTAYLTNAAQHREPGETTVDYYAWKIEDGLIKFRDVNVSAGKTDRVAAKTHAHLVRNYKTLTKGHLV